MLGQLLGLLGGRCGAPLAAASAHALAALLTRQENLAAADRVAAANALRDALLSARPLLAACAAAVASDGGAACPAACGLSGAEAEACTHAAAVLGCAFASAQLEVLCHAATATPLDLEFVGLLMQLTVSAHFFWRSF